jgi:hypothetical protein
VRFLILLVVSPGHQGAGQGWRTREGRALRWGEGGCGCRTWASGGDAEAGARRPGGQR